MANHTLLKELQQKIDYQFKDENLLFTALTHSSYANEHKLHKIHHNERLEFLGDAVLEVVSSDFLFKNFFVRENKSSGCFTLEKIRDTIHFTIQIVEGESL